MLWRRSRWTAVPIVAALMILLVGSNSWVARSLVRSLEWQNIPSGSLPNTEAIVVLGGATKPAFPPRPSVDLSEEGDRILYGAQLYQQQKAPMIIVSGGHIDWFGSAPSEAASMAAVLHQIGVPAAAIIQEPNSRNTYENAVNVQKILKARNIHQILLVTSAMHMPRSLLIFKHQGIAAIPAPTDFLVTNQELQELNTSPQSTVLNLLPNAENLQRFTRALREYIGLIVYRLRGWL